MSQATPRWLVGASVTAGDGSRARCDRGRGACQASAAAFRSPRRGSRRVPAVRVHRPRACPPRRRLRVRRRRSCRRLGRVRAGQPGRRRPPIGRDGRRRRARSTSSPRTTRSCPTTLDLVPGETVLLHVINGGLEVHEAVIGDAAVQDAWEAAEAATVGAPPGPDAGRQRAARTSPGCGSWSVRRARRRRAGPCRRRPTAGRAHRRLPHPGPLGEGHADPGPLAGRRPEPAVEPRLSGARWYALAPAPRGLRRRSRPPRGGPE